MTFIHYVEHKPLRDHMKYEDFLDLVKELRKTHKATYVLYSPAKGDVICTDDIDEELIYYIKENLGKFSELSPFIKGFYLISTPLPSAR